MKDWGRMVQSMPKQKRLMKQQGKKRMVQSDTEEWKRWAERELDGRKQTLAEEAEEQRAPKQQRGFQGGQHRRGTLPRTATKPTRRWGGALKRPLEWRGRRRAAAPDRRALWCAHRSGGECQRWRCCA